MKGIWFGMITGIVAQTCVLLILTYRTNWDKEASAAKDRIREWGGKHDDNGTMNGRMKEGELTTKECEDDQGAMIREQRREGEEHDDAEARGRPGSRGVTEMQDNLGEEARGRAEA
ncbi:hypothetical protein Scep_006631 [Stephania cephalantha]|uniref:Protein DETOXIFICATION n=1 Tax=Stephania cephalantha TaxID=152367 RepID=A0AAP0KA93_9MAGN